MAGDVSERESRHVAEEAGFLEREHERRVLAELDRLREDRAAPA